MIRTSSKQGGAENNRGISGHLFTLHQRFYYALNHLGVRSYTDKGRKWHSSDIEVQRVVIRTIDEYLDCISAETLLHPLIKESAADMVGALEGILRVTNEKTLSLASNVAVKMVSTIPTLILQSHVLDLIRPLTSLLPSRQLQVAVSCATALKLILSNLSSKIEGEVWQIFKETNAVVHIINNIQDFSGGTKPIECLKEMIFLLSNILRRWQSSRFSVWSDAKLMEALGVISLTPDVSVKVAVLQLYSALALCGHGAQKVLQNGENVLYTMVHCMGWSNSVYVQMEGFKLAQCLAINEQGCSKMIALCCEPIVIAIINGMNCWRSQSGKVPKEQMSLLTEACRLALITRWEGEHHNYFWKGGIDRVLLNLLLNNFHKTYQSSQFLSLDELIATAQQNLSENFLVLRPFIWDILGGLAAHCLENFNPKTHGNEHCITLLIICACWAFVDSIQNTRHLDSIDPSDIFRNESASRSVLMMIYSPCKYIASHARFLLYEILRPNGKEYLKALLGKLTPSIENLGVPINNLRTIICLMSLACYSGLPEYRNHIVRSRGIKTLVAFIRWCLRNDVHMRRSSVVPQLHSPFTERTCCWAQTEDWDGEDIPLLFSLWGLAELMHHSSLITHPDIFSGQVDHSEAQLVSELQNICRDTSTPGARWYAAYILSYFGHYGFPNKLGKRIKKAHNEGVFADYEFVLTNGNCVSVHGFILMVRCPSLFPRQEFPLNERAVDGSLVRKGVEKCESLRKEVRMSTHVEHQALLKLLEYVYLGHLQAGVELVKKLKVLFRHCNLQCLLEMLCKRSPKWGTPFPTFDLALALEPARHNFSDIVLEAKATDLINWTCCTCSVSVPHVHVHKVILWSSCEYFQGLFRSGMQDSHSETIKVPVSWEALVKVVKWFYSDELPKPNCGCLWENLDAEERLSELYPLVELCWLADMWLLRDLHDYCTGLIISSLGSSRHLSIKLIQVVASLAQWKLVEAAVNVVAPLYHHLRNSGELEVLDEDLIDMVRTASVRLSQQDWSSQNSLY